MKIVFPDNFVNSKSFLDLCNITQDYGFDGVEITDVEAEKIDRILHTSACKAAIKAGYKNSTAEMKVLAEQVLYTNEIRYCPHGRPVLIEISKYELEKQFGRIQ